MGLHSSVSSLSRFFRCCCWATLKSPQAVSSHQDCVKRDCHTPVLWQALQVIQNCIGWFYCHITLQIDTQFSACCFPPRGFFCFILLPCKYLLIILYLCSGLFFPRWTRFQFCRLNPISFPAIFLTSSGSLVLHCPHWSFKRLLVCPLQI